MYLIGTQKWVTEVQHLRSKMHWRGWNFSNVCTCVGVRSETNQTSQITSSRLVHCISIEISWSWCVMNSDSLHHTWQNAQFGSMFGISFHENSSMTCFEIWWTDASQWKEAIAQFSLFFLAPFGCTCQNFRDYFCIWTFSPQRLVGLGWNLARSFPQHICMFYRHFFCHQWISTFISGLCLSMTVVWL